MRKEIHSIGDLKVHLEKHGHLSGVVVQGLDLSGAGLPPFESTQLEGTVFLGCQMDDALRRTAFEAGAVTFPRLPDLDFNPYRATLYTADELMDGYNAGVPESFAETLDQKIYRAFRTHRQPEKATPILQALAQRLHDHAIDNAVDGLIFRTPRPKVVAIMGGHALKRNTEAFAVVAQTAQLLAGAGYLMASGGGPGAMEATHLGAYFGRCDRGALDRAVEILKPFPHFKTPGWFESAMQVRGLCHEPCDSLAVPTWFYGHEPTNLFPTHVAKYFSNSLREDGLLAIARYGVIFAPGSAGTIQEVFQDAAQNHYGTFHNVSPMVFLGRDYWTREKPVLDLLRTLAGRRQYADLITTAETPEEAAAFVRNHPPVNYRET